MSPRVVIAAGGTAGHVVPALAVADELRALGADIFFVGGHRAEAELVPAAGFPLDQLDVAGLSRTNPLQAARAGLKATRAAAAARSLLGRLRPDVVLGGGGYVAGVVGAAAVTRGVPLVLTEADSHLGLSNRLLARRARKVCLAFPMAGVDDRFVVTGRPVPPPATDRRAARERFAVPEGRHLVLVFGGSLGARSINRAAIEGLPGGAFEVLHACGTRDEEELRPQVPDDGTYRLEPYIDRFSEALLAADLCVARSGGSVFEIAAHALPSILVPYPHAAADHQRGNAMALVERGAAVLVDDADLTPLLLRQTVDSLLADPSRLAGMGEAARSFARPDAAAAIAREALAAAG